MLSKRINYVLFAVAIYFPIFWNLDSLGLQIFDESHNAVNAIEMMQNGNYFVRYYDGAPDLWEPKPPLLIWLQIFFIKLLGLTELSIRLPAALATVGLIAFIIWFFKKNWQDTEGGVFAALTIVTSTGFISYHVSRNGDHDALVTFFLVGYMLFFWNWLKSQNQKHLLFSILFIVLAVFTKSIIGVIFLPGLFLYVLLTGQLFKVIGNLRFWIFSITGFLIVASYYLICEKLHPGHWANVWNMEFLPRYTGSFKDGVNGWKPSFLDDKWYWVKKIYSKTYPIVWTLPLSIVCILKNTNKERRQFWLLLLCCSSTFLYIISNGCVIDWYDAPVYPILAMMSGLILSDIYNGLKTNLQNNISSPPPQQVSYVAFNWIFIAACFAMPYYQILTKISDKLEPDTIEQFGPFLKKIIPEYPNIKKYTILYDSYGSQIQFYIYKYKEQQVDVDKIFIPNDPNFNNLKAGQYVITSDNNVEQKLVHTYAAERITFHYDSRLYRIISKLPVAKDSTKK